RLPAAGGRNKTDFTVRLPGREPIPADALRADEGSDNCRIFFRFAPATETVTGELLWRNQVLSRVALPFLGRHEFLHSLRLQMPTLAVCLGEVTVACQTFVSTQGKGLVASGLLSSPTSLAPVAELRLCVEFRSDPGDTVLEVPLRLTSSQLVSKQA